MGVGDRSGVWWVTPVWRVAGDGHRMDITNKAETLSVPSCQLTIFTGRIALVTARSVCVCVRGLTATADPLAGS